MFSTVTVCGAPAAAWRWNVRRERDSATVPRAKEDDGPDALEHAVIPVSGMTGGDCADKIETALRTAPSDGHAAVNAHTNVAVVDYDSARTSGERLVETIEQTGFTPGTARVRLAIPRTRRTRYRSCNSRASA